MDNFLQDKVCVVTGGTQGIGWATAQALAARGAAVYACGFSRQSLNRALAEREQLPFAPLLHLTRCDVTRRDNYVDWLEMIGYETTGIDVLVNNAAFVRWTDVQAMSIDEAERTMRVAYDGMIYGIKTVLPSMLEAGQGHIVNIGSIAGSIFVGGASAAYAAAKAAVDAYSQTLQVELRKSPVAVTLVRLGTVAGTNFFREHVPPARMPRLLDFFPYLTPPDVAAAVVKALHTKQRVVVLPNYLRFLHLLYLLAPRVSGWLAARGGSGRRQYGDVEW